MIKHQPFNFENYKICESKLYRKKNDWFVNITVQKDVELLKTYDSILAIDIGEKVMATMVSSANMRPTFYGREIRGIRRHYSYLRKQLGRKKLLGKIKSISDKEGRKVSDTLNKISNEIVSEAVANRSVIVLGDLKGIRNSAKGKGKRFNRIVSNMPYYQLTQMIEQKATWSGIPVMYVSEAYTSKTCSKCSSRDTSRNHQSNFKCNSCGYQVNADFNGSKNILKRFGEYILPNGALNEQALNQSLTLETHFFRGG
jgi:IS605 OrfB family transposase